MRISDWSSDVCSSDLDLPGALPQDHHHDQRQVADGGGDEGRGDPGPSDDDTANRRAEAARYVEADAVQRNRAGKQRGGDLLADRRLPRRAEQGHSAADEKGEQKKTGGADMAPKNPDRQKDRADKRGNDRAEEDRKRVVEGKSV